MLCLVAVNSYVIGFACSWRRSGMSDVEQLYTSRSLTQLLSAIQRFSSSKICTTPELAYVYTTWGGIYADLVYAIYVPFSSMWWHHHHGTCIIILHVQYWFVPCSGEDCTDGPWPKGKHESNPDEESHDQDHTQVPYCTPSLVERVPDDQPSEPQLEQIADKIVIWEGLATHLGIKEPKRYEIQRNHRNEYGRQKVEMLYEWRRQNGGSATWKVLVETSLKVQDKQLAEDIVGICKFHEMYVT